MQVSYKQSQHAWLI